MLFSVSLIFIYIFLSITSTVQNQKAGINFSPISNFCNIQYMSFAFFVVQYKSLCNDFQFAVWPYRNNWGHLVAFHDEHTTNAAILEALHLFEAECPISNLQH